jgi:hypothetical protein
MLTEDTARSIGMSSYFPHVRRVFVDILRALDAHYGRPLMMTSTQNVNKVSMPLFQVFITVEAASIVAVFKDFFHVVFYFGDPNSIILVLNFLNLRHSSV